MILSQLPGTQFQFSIRGQCMEPVLTDGQVVTVSKSHIYLPGDILVILSQQGQCLAHRLVGYYWRDGGIKFLTQADAADKPDQGVRSNQVIGKLACPVSLMQRLTSLGRFARFVLRHEFR